MRKVLPLSGGLLFIAALCRPGCVQAQDARPFEDVKPDHWAYQAVTDLHIKGIVTGYPEGHFNGQRTLTRYEFAVALKRALDRLPAEQKPPKGPQRGGAPKTEQSAAVAAKAPGLVRAEVDELLNLAVSFKDELGALGMDTGSVLARLSRMAAAAALSTPRPDPIVPSIGSPGANFHPDRTGDGFGKQGGAALSASPLLLGGLQPGAFGVRARIGSGTATVFGGSLGSTDSALSGAGFDARNLISSMQATASPLPGAQQFFGRPTGSVYPGFAGPPRGRIFGIEGELPLSRNGSIGVKYLDFTADRGGSAGPGSGLFGAPMGDVTLYGANVRLNSIGRFAFSGEASKSVSQRFTDRGGDDDNNAYLLNLNYNGGPITGAAGYQYYDPRFTSPSYLNSLGGLYNPANLQGPYARVGGRLDRLQADLGVDYLTAARNRPGFGGFTQGSSVFRGQAGLGYHFSKQFELTAHYEGVLYDMSGAISASGLRAKPVEQYITLGAGLNLSGNTVLKMAYQIINVQDAGNGFGLAPGGNSPGSASTSVFTTQFAVHF